jgi:PmbA protein
LIKEKCIKRVSEISVNIVNTQVESVRRKDISKTGVRVYRDGFIGVAGALGQHDEEALLKQAEEALKYKISYPFEVSSNIREEKDLTGEILGDAEMLGEYDELFSNLRTCQPDFLFSNKINLVEQEVSLSNDQGLDLIYRDKYMDIGLLFKEKTSINVFDGIIEAQSRSYNRSAFIDTVNEICTAYKNTVTLPPGDRFPVVFSSSDMLPLLKFAEDLNGQRFIGKSSVFSDKIGQRAFSDEFTLFQSQVSEVNMLPFFDAEGTVNENYRYPLIEKGVVITPYTDKKTSRLIDMPLTGSAVADYDAVPNLGFTGFGIEESHMSAKELLAGDLGIFVLVASGGDFTPEGNFATPVQLAMLFDGERFIGRLPELTLSSKIFEMFGAAYRGVSRNPYSRISEDKCLVMDLRVSKL